MATLTLATAFFCLLIGVRVAKENPDRRSNQAFAILSVIFAAWLFCVAEAMRAGALPTGERESRLEFWLRLNAAVSACYLLGLWLLRDAIVLERNARATRLRYSVLLSLVMCSIYLVYFEDYFSRAPYATTGTRSWSYYAHMLLILFSTVALMITTRAQLAEARGIKRLELQIFAYVSGGMVLALFILNGLGNLIGARSLNRGSIFVVFIAYGIMASALTFRKVFTAKQLLELLFQRGTALTAFGIIVVIVITAPDPGLNLATSLLLAVTLGALPALWLDWKTGQWLNTRLARQRDLARNELIQLARQGTDLERLVAQFEQVLSIHGEARSAALLFDQGAAFSSGTLSINKQSDLYSALNTHAWLTPEMLERRKQEPRLIEAREYLQQHALGLLAAVPAGSRPPSLIMAFGVKQNEWPFTYPEIELMQNLGELTDNLLTHSRVASQAVLQARIEHLANMSGGLAHDLKNLITPISSFLVHTRGKYPRGSAEAGTHDEASRSLEIMNDYIGEARFFSQQLTLRLVSTNVSKLFDSAIALTRGRAIRKEITVQKSVAPNTELVSDEILLLRLLANLLSNAIDASGRAGVITLSAHNGSPRFCSLQVADNGSGIAPENLGRIFEPYFTTKRLGDDTRGFGLGLTICQKIANLHGGTIRVQSTLGKGTTVTVDLPIDPADPVITPGQPRPALP